VLADIALKVGIRLIAGASLFPKPGGPPPPPPFSPTSSMKGLIMYGVILSRSWVDSDGAVGLGCRAQNLLTDERMNTLESQGVKGDQPPAIGIPNLIVAEKRLLISQKGQAAACSASTGADEVLGWPRLSPENTIRHHHSFRHLLTHVL